MKKILFLFVFATAITNVFGTTYYWVGGVSGSWATNANWNTTLGGGGTARTPATTDVLVFDFANRGNSAGAGTAIAVSDVSNETIAGLQIISSTGGSTRGLTTVTFSGTIATLTISGDLVIGFYATGNNNAKIIDGGNSIIVGGNFTTVNSHTASSTYQGGTGRIVFTNSAATLASGAGAGNINFQNIEIGDGVNPTNLTIGGALQINGDIKINNNATLSNNNKSFILNSTNGVGGTISGSGTIIATATTGTFYVQGTGLPSGTQIVGTINFNTATAANSTINSLQLNRPNSVVTVGTANSSTLTVSGTITLNAGTIDDGGNTIVVKGSTILAVTATPGTGVHTGIGRIKAARTNAGPLLVTAGKTVSVGNIEIGSTSGAVVYAVGAATNLTINGTLTLSKTGASVDMSGSTVTFQNGNTPISWTAGTVTTSSSTNLNFGSSGNTGGTTFTIPNSVFTSAPTLGTFTINRDNALIFNNQTLTVSGATTISAGTLAMATTLTANGTVNVNGTFQLNLGGWATGSGVWNYGSTGTLAFNTTYGVDNTHVYWPTSNGPVNVSVLTGVLTLNSGANRTVGGLFQTAGGVAFPSATLTLNGTAQINANGYFSNAPTYGSSSILKYNTGTTYGRSTEWNNPASVQLSNGTTLNYPNTGSGAFSTPLSITGNLTVDAGSSLYMDYGGSGNKSGSLTVGGNVTLNGSMSLGNAFGGDLNIGGNWLHTTGTFNANGRAVTFNGTGAQTITNTNGETFAYLTVNNSSGAVLTMNDDVTVSNNLTINAVSALTLISGKSLGVSGNFAINSSASGTGTFVNQNATGGFTVGSASVQQYVSSAATGTAGRNWYISSPVSDAVSSTITTETGNGLVSYNVGTGLWDAAASTMAVMKGYIAKSPNGNHTITFSGGTLNTGTLSTSSLPVGFNLVGNPYPSYADWNLANKTNLNGTMWYRSKELGSYKFYTYNGSTAGYGGGEIGVPANVTNKIPPMQAFWVKVESASGKLEFTNAMRSHLEGTNPLKAPAVTNLVQKVLRLEVSNAVNADEAVVYFNANAQDGYDAYDSPKMSNANIAIPEIYTTVGGEQLVINGMNSIAANKEIPLGFNTGAANTFTIKATEVRNFDADTKVILKDNVLNTESDITDGSAYTFNSDVTNTSSRFTVVFRSPSLTTDGLENNPIDKLGLNIFRNANNQITINRNGSIGNEGMVTVCNAIGQKLMSTPTTETSTVISKPFCSGVYFVTVNMAGNKTTKKVIIN